MRHGRRLKAVVVLPVGAYTNSGWSGLDWKVKLKRVRRPPDIHSGNLSDWYSKDL